MKDRVVYKRRKKRQFDTHRFLSGLIVICMPIMIFCLSANLVLRTGEVYEFSLNSSEIVENSTLATSKEDVVDSFSSFMQHRSAQLILVENVEYDPQDLFSARDKQAMDGLRRLMDVLLVIGAAAFAMCAICYFFLIRWRVRSQFMKGFRRSAFVLFALEAINAVINIAPAIRGPLYSGIVGDKFPDGDNLVLLLGDSFPLQVTMFEVIVAGIILAVMTYITWSVAGRRKYFKRF